MYVKGYLEARAIKQQQRTQKKASTQSQAGKSAASAVKLEGSDGIVDLRDEGEFTMDVSEGEEEGEEEEGGATINDLEDSDDSDEDDDYDPDDNSDSDAPRKKRKSHRGSAGDEEDGENDSNSEDSDSDDSDDSDASDSDNSDADSDASGDQEILKATPVSATKAARGARKPAAAQARSPAASPKKAPVKKSPAKKVAEIVKSPVKKATPGMPVQRAVPLPGQPIQRNADNAVQDLTSEKSSVSAPGAKAKEGRKSAAPVKRGPKETSPGVRPSTAAGSSTGTVSSTVPGSAVVKREPFAVSSVVRLDDEPEVHFV